MKTIKEVSIWDNGTVQKAKVLNAYAVNVVLGNSATFYYQLLTETESGTTGNQLAQGNLTMSGEDYASWDVDNFAWDFIAKQLNLVITGDYETPKPEEPTSEVVVEEEVIAE